MSATVTKPPSGFEEPIPGYRLTEILGRGGFGEVWRATAPGGISKAVKLIFGNDSTAADKELNALNRVKDVRHPFLLSIERIEQRDGTLIIVTELGDRNLQDYYRSFRDKDQSGIPQGELLGMLHDVADVLDYIYEEYALQHLDIKPANLLLFGKRLKVADFGLVKNIYERSPSLVGGLTPTYASPEVFDGQPSRASDQYSLAILYHEMLTGSLPFDGGNAARLAAQHLQEAPNLKALPAEQQSVIARALSKSPLQRFPSCKALIEALQDAVKRTESTASTARNEQLFSDPSRISVRPRRSAAATSPVASASSAAPVVAVSPASSAMVQPTLIVGAGGTAAHLLQRLKERIYDRLGSQRNAIKLVLIDTDPQILDELDREHLEDDLLVTVLTPLRSSTEYRVKGEVHRRWMSRRWLYNIPRNLRTEGLRPLGRLALVSQGPRVQAAIREALQSVKASVGDSGAAFAPQVYVVGSLAGGTGGGMILDLAYALRTELRAVGCTSSEVDGVLLHSTPADAHRDKAHLNALVTLQELQHLSRPGGFYPGEPLLNVPPFHGDNRTFRSLEIVNLGNNLETREWQQQIDNAAEFVFARLTSPLDAHRTRLAGGTAAPVASLVQLQQLGGYSAQFVQHLSRELCLAVTQGWLGLPEHATLGTRTSSQTPTLLLTPSRNDHQAKLRQAASEAETALRQHGADFNALLKRARLTLAQELGTDERTWLSELVGALLNSPDAAAQTDAVVAQLAMESLDRRVGVEQEVIAVRGPGTSLTDQLRSRLASQAMQVAARITDWIGVLVDDSHWGVEAALTAAETCRQLMRDLTGHVTQELQTLRNQQTATRITMTAESLLGDAHRKGKNWLGGRSRNRIVLEEKLIQLGLSVFEELAVVCVDTQVRAIESHVTATIDHLLSLSQELKLLQSAWLSADSIGCEPFDIDREPIKRLLCDNQHRLVAELRLRMERDVLTGSKKLQRFLPQRGALAKGFGEPLAKLSRQVVLHCARRLISLLIQHGPAAAQEAGVNLDDALQSILDEPDVMPIAGAQRIFVIAPHDCAASRFEKRLQSGETPLVPIYADTHSLTVCRETTDVPVAEVVQQLLGDRPGLWQVAENLHTRIDVEWTAPQTPAPDLDDLLSSVGTPSADEIIQATLQLTPSKTP